MLSYSGHFVFYAKNHGFLGPPLRPPRWARGFPFRSGSPREALGKEPPPRPARRPELKHRLLEGLYEIEGLSKKE